MHYELLSMHKWVIYGKIFHSSFYTLVASSALEVLQVVLNILTLFTRESNLLTVLYFNRKQCFEVKNILMDLFVTNM